MIFYDAICAKCGELVEFRCAMADRNSPRRHKDVTTSACDGSLERRVCDNFVTRWHYGRADKKGTLLGPSQNVYHDRDKIKKSRIVSGAHYSGAVSKDRA